MEVADRAPAAPAASRRLPLARILFIVAAGALIALIAAYAARFISAASFHHERAFRVLDEVGAQLDNLQRTLTHQLNFMSPQLAGRECVAALSAADPDKDMIDKANRCRELHAVYLRRLALEGPRVGLAGIDEKLHASACSESSASARQYVLTVRAERPGAPFTIFSCQAAFISEGSSAGNRRNLIAFKGELTETIERFVAQSYFDEVLIALESGAVVASASFRASQATQSRSHLERGRRLGVKDARPMLLRAERPDAKEHDAKGALPAQPVQFIDKIAGQRYRVFVSVLSPAQETWLDSNGGAKPERQGRLYLIGLKHDELREQLADSIGPAGRFALTVLVLLALLAWPLATLRAKAPEEPISWLEAIASLIAIVLIPATLAISVVWVWSYQGVLSWTDAAARSYAHALADVVHTELERGRSMLVQYRDLYDDPPKHSASQGEGSPTASAPLRMAKASNPAGVKQVAASVGPCKLELDNTCTLAAPAGDRYAGWSPFSSVFATNAAGKREGVRYTVYDAPSVSASADYSAREYFLALQQGRGWRASSEEAPYVAQRLFSGGDGSRVLQVAVPRKCGNGFCGIVTGSLSVHSLSAAVAPPLLRFAVIDQRTGQVLFHKDDGRSLSENFFVETEHDPELRALVQVGQSDRFAGYYMGGAYRFHHTPVAGAPWSVLTFYSVRDAGELSWHAAHTALAAYCGVMLLILLGSGLALWIWFKRSRQSVRNFAAGFWHRIGSPCSYARWGVAVLGSGALIVLVYEVVTGWGDAQTGLVSPLTWTMCGLVAIAYLVMRRQHVRSSHGACIALWLLLVSAAPAAWIALGFHDAQVRGLLRDALASASRDVVQRHAAIADDLRRWLSSRDPQSGAFPDPWLLAQPSATMPIAGFTSGACDDASGESGVWTACVFKRPPLAALIVQRPLDFWRRETWRRAAQDETQQRRIDLLDDAETSNPSCASAAGVERCTVRTSDGRNLVVRIVLREPEAYGALGDKGRFDAAAGTVLKVGSLGVLFASIWVLAQLARRRLLGVRSSGRAPPSPRMAERLTTVFHTRELTGEAVEELLGRARAGGENPTPLTRINLATHPLAELAGERLKGTVLLTNLDIALTDAARRRDILRLLERLLDAPDVHTIIHSRSSPLERLYHPERFPESTAEHAMSLDESLRWDNVLQKLEAHDFVEPLRVRRHPDLAVVDHHRVWKLSTRAERLLLYQLATGRLANPRNAAAIDALIARGLVRLDPWPQIADRNFEAFVRTAETSRELAEWQRQAVQASGKRMRTIVITSGLALLLVAVLWFNWTASDQFKIISTLLAASVAFLSQIGQAFSFVRGGPGKS